MAQGGRLPPVPRNMSMINDMERYGNELPKNHPIAVVGSGVIGMFTVYDLIQRGFANITVISENR